ncbi:MAG: SRPBCC family protein [Deltaproteobacteria bacterium]|nr:SRPBCC family protein [Deltaproteobacteria bacterium]
MSLAGAQEFSAEVAAPVRDCFAAITDFDAYPAWSPAIEEIHVLERYPDGLARLVEFHINMKLKTLRYVLEYEYNEPHRLTWHSVEGDIQSIEGSYEFEKLTARTTQATCRQAVVTGFWVPGPIRRLLERSAVQQSVLEFKAEAERRSRAAAKPRAKSKVRS